MTAWQGLQQVVHKLQAIGAISKLLTTRQLSVIKPVGIVAALASLVTGCGAAGNPLAPTHEPATDIALRILVSNGEGKSAMATLRCKGGKATSTGFLTADPNICARVLDLQQFLATEPPKDRICAQIFGGPETAKVSGKIGTVQIDRAFSRRNSCEVADWDRAAVLFAGAPVSRYQKQSAQ